MYTCDGNGPALILRSGDLLSCPGCHWTRYLPKTEEDF